MAISWKFSINEIGKAVDVKGSGNYNISATVTDDTKPEGYQEETVSAQGKYDTPERKDALHAALKAEYLKKAAATAVKAELELSAKTAVEAI